MRLCFLAHLQVQPTRTILSYDRPRDFDLRMTNDTAQIALLELRKRAPRDEGMQPFDAIRSATKRKRWPFGAWRHSELSIDDNHDPQGPV